MHKHNYSGPRRVELELRLSCGWVFPPLSSLPQGDNRQTQNYSGTLVKDERSEKMSSEMSIHKKVWALPCVLQTSIQFSGCQAAAVNKAEQTKDRIVVEQQTKLRRPFAVTSDYDDDDTGWFWRVFYATLEMPRTFLQQSISMACKFGTRMSRRLQGYSNVLLLAPGLNQSSTSIAVLVQRPTLFKAA